MFPVAVLCFLFLKDSSFLSDDEILLSFGFTFLLQTQKVFLAFSCVWMDIWNAIFLFITYGKTHNLSWKSPIKVFLIFVKILDIIRAPVG